MGWWESSAKKRTQKPLQTPKMCVISLFGCLSEQKRFSILMFSQKQQKGQMAACNKPEEVIKLFKFFLLLKRSVLNCWFYLTNHSGCLNTSILQGKRKKHKSYRLGWPGPTQQWKLCNWLMCAGSAMEKKGTNKNRNQPQEEIGKSFK